MRKLKFEECPKTRAEFVRKYKEDNIVLKDLMILLFYLLLIAICKLPYVLLDSALVVSKFIVQGVFEYE